MKTRRSTRVAQRGFTFVELLGVIAIVVLSYVVVMRNLLPLLGQAEEASFISTVAALRSSVSMETSRRLVRGGIASVGAMDGINPMTLLQSAPAGYVGEVDDADDVCAGCWGFDASEQQLVYRVEYVKYFVEKQPIVRFDVRVAREPSGSLLAVNLRQLDPADWQADSPDVAELFGFD